MPYTGKFLMARDVVALVAPHFPNSKVKALATCLGESSLCVGAWHDNLNTAGEVVSRDCGLMQISIPARLIGTTTEFGLRTPSLEPDEYLEVAKANILAAYKLYTQPWIRNGKQDIRRWQPWVAYTTGWAMFGEPWVWKQTDGEPTGPWVETGRFLHKAIRGVANWHLLIAKDMNADEAFQEAVRLADVYGAKGTLLYNDKSFVYWTFPKAPVAPPADGVGPRPERNEGL